MAWSIELQRPTWPHLLLLTFPCLPPSFSSCGSDYNKDTNLSCFGKLPLEGPSKMSASQGKLGGPKVCQKG
jgi:hypothetical protein